MLEEGEKKNNNEQNEEIHSFSQFAQDDEQPLD